MIMHQVLCEERGTAVSRLTQQVEVLLEKVRLLSAELSQHDRDAHELAADLRAQLQDTQVRYNTSTRKHTRS
jgi:3-phosphoglycerate kinase